jgi:hypothetical protein
MNKLLGHLYYSTTVLTGRLAPGRRATVFSDDVFLVSYPKSGNTWMRFLVGNLANPDDPVTFANVERRVPSIYGMPDREMRTLPRPRYIKTHEAFHPFYQTIIYTVRDPRDVAVSYYHYHLKIRQLPPGFPIDSFVPDFIAENLYSPFGPWAENVMSWLAMAPSRRKFLFLRYEDLLLEPEQQLGRIATSLDIEPSPERIARTLELSSANRMRGLEQKQADKWSTTKRTRSDVPFVRAAKSGQWSDALSADSVAAIERAWGPIIHFLGYPLVNNPRKLADESPSWKQWQAQVDAVANFAPCPAKP